jgi:phosphomannomutase/phosphoglucomutase
VVLASHRNHYARASPKPTRMKVFGSSGVRGVANRELDPETAMQVAAAAGTVLGTGRVAIARDPRLTGDMLGAAVASGLASVGAEVVDVGIVPTPALQAYCEAAGVAGVMVTASHNPPEYNGIKLIGADGVELTRDRLEAVEATIEAGAQRVAWDAVGGIDSTDGAGADYRESVLAAVDRERIASADLTVAIDPGHGAAAATSPRLFRDLGCDVLTVNAQQDGNFPGRDPEPIEANLTDLARLVRTSEADLGIAHDGDGDRAIFVDESGAFIEGDAALAALAADECEPGDAVVSAVNASQRLVDVANAAGADLHLTPIGSTYLITEIRELQAEGTPVPIAGEGNGGIIFPDYRVARDGAYTAARFCSLLAAEPASDVVDDYDRYHNVRRNLAYADEEERARMLAAIERAARDADATLDTTDGFRLDYGDGWVLARPSGTEPVIRVYAEARDRERATKLAERFTGAIRS